MLGSLSSLTISFSCPTPFSSDTGLSPACSCRISPHYTLSAKSDRNSASPEIVTPARWSAQYFPPFLRKKNTVSYWNVQGRYSISLVVWLYHWRKNTGSVFSGISFSWQLFLVLLAPAWWLLSTSSLEERVKESCGATGEIKWHHYKWHKR